MTTRSLIARFRRRPCRGVTFFEITVVFVVIAILVVVAVLSTRRLAVETKLARVREEHRVLTRALQNYYFDLSDFPTQIQGLAPLREPVTYLASIPRDIFARGEDRSQPYVYRTWHGELQTVWLLLSRGPDGDIDLDETPTGLVQPLIPSLSGTATVGGTRLPDFLIALSYDPTNGLGSSGDIYTLSPFAY